MSNYFCKNMQALMEKWGATPYTLAPYLGTEPSTIYRWINPEVANVPRSRMRVTIAEFFGVEPNELVDGLIDVDSLAVKNPEQKGLVKRTYRGKRIPLVSLDDCLVIAAMFDDDIGTEEQGLTPVAKEWLPAAPGLEMPQDSLIALRMTGSAMAPTIQSGDLVYVHFMFGGDMTGSNGVEISEGDLVLAEPVTSDKLEDRGAVIRKLVYGDNERDEWLAATNPDFPGTRTIKSNMVLGKVVAIFRKL